MNPTGEWASVSGTADIITERETVRKYYSPGLKAWLGDLGDGKHDGGPEDPRIGVIKVTAKTATYAIASSTFITRGLEIAKGVITGEAPKVNKLREITESELQQCEQFPFGRFDYSSHPAPCVGSCTSSRLALHTPAARWLICILCDWLEFAVDCTEGRETCTIADMLINVCTQQGVNRTSR